MTDRRVDLARLIKIYSTTPAAEFVTEMVNWFRDNADAVLAAAQEKVEPVAILQRLGHVHHPDTRCHARVKPMPAHLLPPGPANPPIFCCLKEGHEGPHRFSHGGMHPSVPFRDTDEVEYREPSCGTCVKCSEAWPCETARTISRLAERPATLGEVPDGWIDRHQIAAGDCPPQSMVVLVSSIRRMLSAAPEATTHG